MKRSSTYPVLIVGAVLLLVAAVIAVVVRESPEPDPDTRPSSVLDPPATETHPPSENHQGFLYGRVTTHDDATYEGRLRWGGDEEAFWGNYFMGFKSENPWSDHAPKERRAIEIFGVEFGKREEPVDLRRPFMARLGNIARIDARGDDVRVTLKSGSVFDLDRNSAGDFDDGVRMWDDAQGVVDLGPRQIRSIELLPFPSTGAAPYRLYGTVHTRQGDFTGFVRWDREKCVGTDELDGLRFDTIRSVARDGDSALVTLIDGREIMLSVSHGNRGIYVDDRRYGRVLVSWNAFERVDFAPGGSGPAYDDFPPGQPLTGSVTTRAGRLLTGRLVFDLDESETIETLDAPSEGVDYTIPFGLIASIVSPARVTLHDGEELRLEPTGDLGEGNGGMLIFVDDLERPEYVPWTDVEQVRFDRPAEIERR